ncbi:MAG TPA: type II secretion system F family protein [Longimicrobiales bacterium]|nr:type II secretion system F family protein [Longimicrobiales bacterium]
MKVRTRTSRADGAVVKLFAYEAVDPAGRRTRGRLTGATAAAVTRDLESRGLLALDVEEAAGAIESAGWGIGRRRGVMEFTRAVAALLPAGMPLARALAAGVSASPSSLRAPLEMVRAKVERGDELAAALAEHPRLFSPLYVGMVRAGERSGALDSAFERLAVHLERDDELRSKLVSMSIYPILLATVGLGAVMILMLLVLPRFADLLQSSGAALPATTAMIIGGATAVRESWRILLIIPPLLIVLLTWLRTTETGRRISSTMLVSVPIVGTWRRQALAAGFARMVGELLSGGAPLLTALADARDCMSDPVARDETERIRTRVREGSALNAAISERSLFPPMLPQLVALGEEAGRLAEFMLKSADMLERRTERAVERMVALAEPAMIVLFGGLVALVALALLQAIYGVNAGSL